MNTILCPLCKKYGEPWGEVCMRCFIKQEHDTKAKKLIKQEDVKKCRSCEQYHPNSKFSEHTLICSDCANSTGKTMYGTKPLPYS